jgi:hypothetical protein
MICQTCQGTGFVIIEHDKISSAKRCDCCKPTAAAPGKAVSSAVATAATEALCDVLEFAPKTELGRVLISNALISMCPTEQSVWWLVGRAPQLYRKWGACGILGLRQILCSKYAPRDGVMLSGSDEYPEGIPSDRPLDIPSPTPLPPGHGVTADLDFEQRVQALSRVKRIPPRRSVQ